MTTAGLEGRPGDGCVDTLLFTWSCAGPCAVELGARPRLVLQSSYEIVEVLRGSVLV